MIFPILEENSKINIFGNLLIKESISEIKDLHKYYNFFNKGDHNKEIENYIFLFILIKKNIEMLMDTKSILNGHLLNNKYNSLLSEECIILLFMRIKIYIFKNISNFEIDEIYQEIFNTKIKNYEDFLNKDTRLLDKSLDNTTQRELILKEVKRVNLSSLGFFLTLSNFFYNYKLEPKTKENKGMFIKFISKIEDKLNNFLMDDSNLNISEEKFWKYLISCI